MSWCRDKTLFDSTAAAVRTGDSTPFAAAAADVTLSPAINSPIALLVFTLDVRLHFLVDIVAFAHDGSPANRTILVHSCHPLS